MFQSEQQDTLTWPGLRGLCLFVPHSISKTASLALQHDEPP
ncbi:MAG TPA: hypothetical protein [Caudoviricetes sp.]|nr:MAG TPA: hypothetical protein [Caudoviricetes sp.]